MTGHRTKMDRLTANAAWTPVSSRLGVICNRWAGRRDLVVYVGEDGGLGKAPAFFLPEKGEIEINSKNAFGSATPAMIGDLRLQVELAKFPVAGGLALHESGHARYSRSDWKAAHAELSASAFSVFELLEETRVEGRMADRFPADVGYLRASAKTLVFGDGVPTSMRFAVQAVLGRHWVGVLDESDIGRVVAAVLSAPGWDQALLREVRDRILVHKDLDDIDDAARMIELARELDAMMPPEEPSGSDPDPEGALAEAIAGALSRAERGGSAVVLSEALRAEAADARAEAEALEHEHKRHEHIARQIFPKKDEHGAFVPTALQKSREPNDDERRAAVTLARELEKARYRDRWSVDVGSVTPPGRFNPGEAMRRSAAIALHAPSEGYKPFTDRKWEEVDETPLTVGIMSDVSGSMTAVQPAIGSAVWVIANAVYRLSGAKAAALYFGSKITPGLSVGQHPKLVRVFTGRGGREDFDGGFKALDGELNLLNGKGARVLVVASDGHYTPEQRAARDKWTAKCVRSGVAVVWLALTPNPDVAIVPGLEIVTVSGKLSETAAVIGSACVRTLARVSGN